MPKRHLFKTQWQPTDRPEFFTPNGATMTHTTTVSPARPGATAGQAQEFTMISKLKPGGAERMRKLFADGFTGERQKNTDRIGTVHDLRFVIFDNDTRVFFASTFDGSWDSYMDDFGTIIPDEIDLLFHECVDYPGIHSPRFKDWAMSVQITAAGFYSAYPEAPVREVWKALKAKKAFDALLDSAAS
ncbi:hypothetical protein [Variovorax sp. GT1P44]|uniref:hypothetical protein n=1 Tax=Variovorax sp. GT1P44 TaxID=3443742 RepID=UPI003F488C59